MTAHPKFPGKIVEQISDLAKPWPVKSRNVIFDTPYIKLIQETVAGPDNEFDRTLVRPNDAIGILAVDDDGRVLLVSQYRHPVGGTVVEIPAGTRDVVGEDPVQTVHRELAEEADLVAKNVKQLLSLTMTPGYSSERLIVFLATELSPAARNFDREDEEAQMAHYWMTPESAIKAIESGFITDAKTVAAIYAYERSGR